MIVIVLLKKISTYSNRIYILDVIRGIAIIFMVLYHLLFDLVYFFNITVPLFHSPILKSFMLGISGTFVFIAGVSSNFSQNNLKRGLRCFSIALFMTIATFIILPYSVYVFGVLHLLGISMVIVHYIKAFLEKVNSVFGMVTAFFIMLITFNISVGYLNLILFRFYLPTSLYHTKFLFWLGFPNREFSSSDYFPIFPWFWCFVAGFYFGVLVKERRLPQIFYSYKPKYDFLATIGVNSMFIYVVHQPIIYLTLLAIFYFIN